MPVYFCVTQRCRIIAKLMEIRGVDRAFSPQIIRKQRKKGENVEKRFDLLPGYVFIYNEEPLTDWQLFYGMDGVVRRVGIKDRGYVLEGPDRDFAMKLLEKDGVVGSMRGTVTEIDCRKERAKVEFVFDRNSCSTWISLEAVKNLDRNEGE